VSWQRLLGAIFFVVGFNLSSYTLYKGALRASPSPPPFPSENQRSRNAPPRAEYLARADAARAAPAPRSERPPARNGVITKFAGVDDAWELSPWRRKPGEGDDPGAGGAFHARVAAPDGGWRDEAEAKRLAARDAAVRLRTSTRDLIADADRARWAAAEFESPAGKTLNAPSWEAPGAGAGSGGGGGAWEGGATPLVLVVCYNRPRYLAETLRGLSHVTGLARVAVAVSQDGGDALVAGVADTFGGVPADDAEALSDLDAAALDALLQPGDARSLAPPATARFARWRHARTDKTPLGGRKGAPPRPTPGHVALAAHYGWALARAFGDGGASHVIIMEDDMLVSRDCLTFFAAAAPLLRADPTLWCASSWNDNGARALLSDTSSLRRTGFFPGLGWMLTAALWSELAPRWPGGNWDHWMRSDDVARGRECVVPQVPRNLNIGRRGANMQAWLFDRHLARMGFAGGSGVASFGDLAYLKAEAWEERLRAAVAAPVVEWRDLTRAQLAKKAIKAAARAGQRPPAALLLYTSEQYAQLAKLFGAFSLFVHKKPRRVLSICRQCAEIWPTPRGGSRGVTFVHDSDVAYVLADARGCELLPAALQLLPPSGLAHVAAARGDTCNATCAADGGACDGGSFWWVNRCAALRAAFPCERGCALAVGPDVPAYNDDAKSSAHQQCLVTETRSRCDARHHATRRLCPCVPRPGGAPLRTTTHAQ
jgi:hypothetical protein